ncbi:hypothetical protein C7Y72_00915 [Paraconexibacter algicola]|uniref:Uncharacterized protein n=1 Tax=Paraconexibacter algicola TaxID=2133960 RepID=A0A2T4UGI7_9ACTN|nr:hypothetical protein C7Y72_00915 [Paraconexibacter algicola]
MVVPEQPTTQASPPAADGDAATAPTAGTPRARRVGNALLLTLIVGLLVATWASVAGALDLGAGSGAGAASGELAKDARSMDAAMDLLDGARSVTDLRAAGRMVGDLRLGIDDQRRALAGNDDQRVADIALRTHREIASVLDGWAVLEKLEDGDLAAWARREAPGVLRATNRLRDGLVAKAQDAVADDGLDIDHARARAVTLKVARYLVKTADAERARKV